MDKTLNNKFIILSIISILLLSNSGCNQRKNINLFLGQEPPGTTPKIFAPGIVSTDEHHEFSCSFSPDGKEFYFNRQMQIMVCRLKNGSWTDPEPVNFTENYRAHEPFVTHDNKYLYFGSMRPNPEFPDMKQPYGIWRVERTDQGWDKLKYVGFGMYVTITNNDVIYLTDIRGKDHSEQGIAKTTLIENHFGPLIRQEGGVVNPAPDRLPGRHPFIAPDESFIIFDSYDKETREKDKLFICFRENDGNWGKAIELDAKINSGEYTFGAYISPDGKYLFYSSDSDIYWVDASFIDEKKDGSILK